MEDNGIVFFSIVGYFYRLNLH